LVQLRIAPHKPQNPKSQTNIERYIFLNILNFLRLNIEL